MTIKILFLSGREFDYQRNQIIYKSFVANGYDVTVLRPPHEINSILGRSLQISFQAANILTKEKFDVIYVGFYGYFLIHTAKLLSQTPILFDPFVSNYETLIEDRKVKSEKSIFTSIYSWIDKSALRIAKHNILDTNTHIEFFCNKYKMDPSNFSRIFVGCDETIFSPINYANEDNIALFYGSYQPLHGISTIITAASLIKNKNIKFLIIGDGKDKPKLMNYANEIGVNNVYFLPTVKLRDLPMIISKSKVCLGGPFGSSGKGNRVITGKTFQSLAMGKATIVGDNPANHELLKHGIDAWFCKMGNPQGLADSINFLFEDATLRHFIGDAGKHTFEEMASLSIIKGQIKGIIESLT